MYKLALVNHQLSNGAATRAQLAQVRAGLGRRVGHRVHACYLRCCAELLL